MAAFDAEYAEYYGDYIEILMELDQQGNAHTTMERFRVACSAALLPAQRLGRLRAFWRLEVAAPRDNMEAGVDGEV
jgi:hypothetical protein